MSNRTSHRVTSGLRFILFATTVPACMSWKHTELAPVPDSVTAPSREVRVVMRSGNKITLRDARVRNDTLHAVRRSRDSDSQGSSMAIPVSQIADVQTRQVSTPKTIAATVWYGFSAFVIGAVIYVLANGGPVFMN